MPGTGMPHGAWANVFSWSEGKRPVAFKAGVWGEGPNVGLFYFDIAELNDF